MLATESPFSSGYFADWFPIVKIKDTIYPKKQWQTYPWHSSYRATLSSACWSQLLPPCQVGDIVLGKKDEEPPGEEEEDEEGRGEAALHAEVQGGVAEKATERPSTEVVCEQHQTGGARLRWLGGHTPHQSIAGHGGAVGAEGGPTRWKGRSPFQKRLEEEMAKFCNVFVYLIFE